MPLLLPTATAAAVAAVPASFDAVAAYVVLIPIARPHPTKNKL